MFKRRLEYLIVNETLNSQLTYLLNKIITLF